MRHNIVIMTKSKKGDDGYCVTGIDLDSNEWIRLNIRGEYSFPRQLFCYENGAEVQVLDTVSIDITSKDYSSKLQPENYFCDPFSIQYENIPREKAVADRVKKDREQHSYIFYNNSNHVLSESLETKGDEMYSLMVVEPEKLAFRRNEKGRLLASFEYGNNKYSGIRVTDIDYRNSDKYSQKTDVHAEMQSLIVMSLGEKYYNPTSGNTENWKFAASIIEKESIKDENVRDGKETNKFAGAVERNAFGAQNILIKTAQTPGTARFDNYEELRQYLEKGLKVYNNTQYSIDNAEQAASDLEVLKAVRKKLTSAKKSIETTYNLPIKEVIEQLDTLIDMVKEPYAVIDKMLKDNAKSIKEREIRRYAFNKALILDQYAISVVDSPSFFNPRWKNISYRDKAWKKDVDKIIQQAKIDLENIEKEGGENRPIMLAYYLKNLSLEGINTFLSHLGGPENPPTGPTPSGSYGPGGETSGGEPGDGGETHITEPCDNTVKKTIVIRGFEKDIAAFLEEAGTFNVTIEAVSKNGSDDIKKQGGDRCNRCKSLSDGKCMNEESTHYNSKVSRMDWCEHFKRFNA